MGVAGTEVDKVEREEALFVVNEYPIALEIGAPTCDEIIVPPDDSTIYVLTRSRKV